LARDDFGGDPHKLLRQTNQCAFLHEKGVPFGLRIQFNASRGQLGAHSDRRKEIRLITSQGGHGGEKQGTGADEDLRFLRLIFTGCGNLRLMSFSEGITACLLAIRGCMRPGQP
jgi:hypothetical protein